MKIIAIETATDICSITYFENGHCQGLIEDVIPRQHAEKLPLFYIDLVNKTDLKLSEIDAIAVSIGPGSFTGLRIGLSYAKGLAYSQQKPIIPVPTMYSIFHSFKEKGINVTVILLSHGNKYFIQHFEGNSKNAKLSEIEVVELDDINKLQDIENIDILIHYGCEKLFNNNDKNIQHFEVKPSSKWIGELAQLNFHEWIVKNPYKVVPEYISPFKIGN